MAFKADAAWARAYMEKKGRPAPPDLRECDHEEFDRVCTSDFGVPGMEEGDPCRRCGSGLPGYRIPLRDGDRVWVCEACEDKTIKRLNRRGREE